MHPGGNWLLFSVTYGISPLIAKPLSHVYLSNQPIPHFLDGLLNGRAASDLRPMLDNPVVLTGRLHHLPPFPDTVRTGLFDIDILACLASPDGPKRVPVIGGGERNDVDGFVFQKLSYIGITDRS